MCLTGNLWGMTLAVFYVTAAVAWVWDMEVQDWVSFDKYFSFLDLNDTLERITMRT